MTKWERWWDEKRRFVPVTPRYDPSAVVLFLLLRGRRPPPLWVTTAALLLLRSQSRALKRARQTNKQDLWLISRGRLRAARGLPSRRSNPAQTSLRNIPKAGRKMLMIQKLSPRLEVAWKILINAVFLWALWSNVPVVAPWHRAQISFAKTQIKAGIGLLQSWRELNPLGILSTGEI